MNIIDQNTFETASHNFLGSLDCYEQVETYCTARENAYLVLESMKEFLFKEEIDKEKRREQYLKLKAEFEQDTGKNMEKVPFEIHAR